MLAPRAACSPSPFTERGLGGEVGEASEIAAAFPQVDAKPCTLISCPPLLRRGRGGTRSALHARDSPLPRRVRGAGGEGEKQRARPNEGFISLETPIGITQAQRFVQLRVSVWNNPLRRDDALL